MEETKKIPIHINITGSSFPLEVSPDRERPYRIGGEQVNEVIESYKIKYGNHVAHGKLTDIDLWKLTALHCAAKAALDADLNAEVLNRMDAFTQQVSALIAEERQSVGEGLPTPLNKKENNPNI
jgi:hypothetical protein